jgi:hydrogenase expression/formation protein HypE
MRLGKLDNDQLVRLVLDKFVSRRSETVNAPGIGRDCALVDFSGDLTAVSCDPITSAGIGQLGRLTVHVNCNDAAAAGAEPVGLLVTLLAPPSATEAEIGQIADDLAEAAASAGVDILGGHTEVTDAVTRFVTSTTVLGRLNPARKPCGIRPGNDLVMTKYAGLEGTLLIAEDSRDLLPGLDAQDRSSALSLKSQLSVVPESRVAVLHGATAMHDVTEGGILGAAWEMAFDGECGVRICRAAIPVLPVTQKMCGALGLNPLRLISSGSMLIACEDGPAMAAALANAGIMSAVIGEVVEEGICFMDGTAIDPPGADEIYSLVSYK